MLIVNPFFPKPASSGAAPNILLKAIEIFPQKRLCVRELRRKMELKENREVEFKSCPL